MNVTIIDFETYFDAGFDLRKLSIPEYVGDSRFRVHGIAIRLPDGSSEFRADVTKALTELKGRFGEDLQATTVSAEQAALIVRSELSHAPEWANGLPVACEVGIADRYAK